MIDTIQDSPILQLPCWCIIANLIKTKNIPCVVTLYISHLFVFVKQTAMTATPIPVKMAAPAQTMSMSIFVTVLGLDIPARHVTTVCSQLIRV